MRAPTSDRPLNPREAAFVQHYAVLGDAAESIRRAGYPGNRAKKAGYDMLQKPRVRAAVEQARAEIAAEVDAERRRAQSAVADRVVLQAVTEREVIETAREIVRLAMEAKDYSVARKANRDLGETLGMFRQRVTVDTPETPPSRLSDIERKRLLAEFFADRSN